MTKQSDYFTTITKVCRALGTTLDRDEILRLIVQSAVETMGGKAACLFLLDEEKGTYVPFAQTGLSKNYVHAGLDHVKKEIPVLLKKGCIHYRDAAADPSPCCANLEGRRIEIGIARNDFADPSVHGEAWGVRVQPSAPKLVELAPAVRSQSLQRFHGTSACRLPARQSGAF